MNIILLCASLLLLGFGMARKNLLPAKSDTDLKLNVFDFFRLKNYNVFNAKKESKNKVNYIINRKTGNKNLILVDCGKNKAVLLSTLRQITNIDRHWASSIINQSPGKFMTNVSEQEADLTKQALEFVGAKVEIE